MCAKKYKDKLQCQYVFDQEVIPAVKQSIAFTNKKALDNQTDDFLDPSLKISHQLFEEVLKESINNDYAQFHVFRFLNKLKEVDSGFKFHVY